MHSATGHTAPSMLAQIFFDQTKMATVMARIAANIGCYEDNPELTTVETDPDAPDAQEPGQHWDVEENDLLSDGM